MDSTEVKKQSLRVEMLSKMSDLATASLGLVAALAWNDAITGLFTLIFPKNGTLIAQFGYAITVTVVIVLITYKLSRLTDVAKQKLDAEKSL